MYCNWFFSIHVTRPQMVNVHNNGLEQDCSNSSALAINNSWWWNNTACWNSHQSTSAGRHFEQGPHSSAFIRPRIDLIVEPWNLQWPMTLRYYQTSSIRHQNTKLKCFSSCLAVVLAKSIEACFKPRMKIIDVVGTALNQCIDLSSKVFCGIYLWAMSVTWVWR